MHDPLRHAEAGLAALVASTLLVLALAPPVLARADPPPPWGDPYLVVVAIGLVVVSLLLSLILPHRPSHRH